MSRRTPTTTARTDCEHGCGTRIIIARRVPHPVTAAPGKGWMPALNWAPDPLGPAAATQRPHGGWAGFFLAKNEDLPGPEWTRHAVHECDGSRRHAQRGQWTSAIGDLHRSQRRGRGRRKRPAPTPELPGMVRLWP